MVEAFVRYIDLSNDSPDNTQIKLKSNCSRSTLKQRHDTLPFSLSPIFGYLSCGIKSEFIILCVRSGSTGRQMVNFLKLCRHWLRIFLWAEQII